MAYTTAADVKTYLGITSSSDDTLISTLIADAKGIIDAHCHRTFEASADSTRYCDAVHDVDYPESLTLHLDYDLCSITTVVNGDGTTVTSSQYVHEPRNFSPWYALTLLPSANIAWTYTDDWQNAIAITGKWAYATTAPADIAFAALRLAAWLYRQKDSSRDNSQDRALMSASGVVILPSRLPNDVQDILSNYIRRSYGK